MKYDKSDIRSVHWVIWSAAVEQKFNGFDPYDAMSSNWRVLKSNKLIRLFTTYLNLYSPINFRRLLGIKQGVNPSSLAHFLSHGLSHVHLAIGEAEANELTNFLAKRTLKGIYGHHCWYGHGYQIQLGRGLQPDNVPGIIGTQFTANALLSAELRFDHNRFHAELDGTVDFLIQSLLSEYAGETFFRYKPISPDSELIFNASSAACCLYVKLSIHLKRPIDSVLVSNVLKTLISHQKEDGSWSYGVNLKTGAQKNQIDFHQGYILDDLIMISAAGFTAEHLDSTIEKGLRFYADRQIDSKGRCHYRYPRLWPIDIQNQAQAIKTFSIAARANPEFFETAKLVLDYTFKHFYNNKGGFYFQKWPLFTNKIHYPRWSSAPMFEAIGEYLKTEKLLAHA